MFEANLCKLLWVKCVQRLSSLCGPNSSLCQHLKTFLTTRQYNSNTTILFFIKVTDWKIKDFYKIRKLDMFKVPNAKHSTFPFFTVERNFTSPVPFITTRPRTGTFLIDFIHRQQQKWIKTFIAFLCMPAWLIAIRYDLMHSSRV